MTASIFFIAFPSPWLAPRRWQGLAVPLFSRLHAKRLAGRKPTMDQMLNSRLMAHREDI
jgi:hypothetical protein